jgi:hypothetical protein
MDWLRSEDLKEEKNVTAPVVIIAVPCTASLPSSSEAHHRSTHRINPECLDSSRSGEAIAVTILLREEPDEDEEEEDDRKEEDDDGDEGDDGYSE